MGIIPELHSTSPSLEPVLDEKSDRDLVSMLRIPQLGASAILPETGKQAAYWHGDFNIYGDSAVLLASEKSKLMVDWYFGVLPREMLPEINPQDLDLAQHCIDVAEYPAPNLRRALQSLSGFMVANFYN